MVVFPCMLNFVCVLGGVILRSYFHQNVWVSCTLSSHADRSWFTLATNCSDHSAIPRWTTQSWFAQSSLALTLLFVEHPSCMKNTSMLTASTQSLLSTSEARGHKRSRRRKVTQTVFSWEYCLTLRMSSCVLLIVNQTGGAAGRTSSLHRIGTLWYRNSGIGYQNADVKNRVVKSCLCHCLWVRNWLLQASLAKRMSGVCGDMALSWGTCQSITTWILVFTV